MECITLMINVKWIDQLCMYIFDIVVLGFFN